MRGCVYPGRSPFRCPMEQVTVFTESLSEGEGTHIYFPEAGRGARPA